MNNINQDYLSEEVRHDLTELKKLFYKKSNISDNRTIGDLIHFYKLTSVIDFIHLNELIKNRIKKGINRDQLWQLKLLYTYLGHFLQQLKEL